MPARRRPQSFRGLIREHLAYIEHELERGIDHPTVRLELGIESVSPKAFRDALYHARRRARNRPAPTLKTQANSPSGAAHASLNPAPGRGTAAAPRSRPAVPPSPNGKPKTPSGSNRGAAIKTPRDFLELVRSTDDSEIL